MLRGLLPTVLFAALGCGPTLVAPPACPEPATAEAPGLGEGPVPPVLSGHYEVVSLQPKGHPAAPPETYLLAPDERSKCAFVRIVMSFERQTLTIRYEALCVEPEERTHNPVPLKWCSTEGTAHIAWGEMNFELPAPAGTRANVQQIASYAPGSAPKTGSPERTVWGCKFNLDAQRFDIVERSKDKLRILAPKYGAEWVLKPTDRPNVDPDDVVDALRAHLHPVSPPVPERAPDSPSPSPGHKRAIPPGDDQF